MVPVAADQQAEGGRDYRAVIYAATVTSKYLRCKEFALIPIAEVAYEYCSKQIINELKPREPGMRLGERWQSMPSPLT